jgi:hypothetical protein
MPAGTTACRASVKYTGSRLLKGRLYVLAQRLPRRVSNDCQTNFGSGPVTFLSMGRTRDGGKLSSNCRFPLRAATQFLCRPFEYRYSIVLRDSGCPAGTPKLVCTARFREQLAVLDNAIIQHNVLRSTTFAVIGRITAANRRL